MSTLFDDVSRIIAGPVSRRQALRLVGRTVGGGVLASLGLASGFRAFGAPAGVACSKGHCPSGDFCCGTGASAICCPTGYTCCGPPGSPFCCAPGCTCCLIEGKGHSEQACCPGKLSSSTCPPGCTGTTACRCSSQTCPHPS